MGGVPRLRRRAIGNPFFRLLVKTALVSAIVTTLTPILAIDAQASAPELLSQQAVGRYLVRVSRDLPGCGGEYFEIFRGGKALYTSHGRCEANVRIGALDVSYPDDKFITPGADVTGGKEPDVVFSSHTGNPGCCLTFHIFEIGKEFREIGSIHAQQDDPAAPHFVHLEDTGGVQIVLHDWTFAGWHARFAESPAPLVILHYNKGAFVLDERIMRQPAPSLEMVKAEASPIRWRLLTRTGTGDVPSWPSAPISPDLWAGMLSLIYAGHQNLAWKYLDYAWPENVHGKDRFLIDFNKQLASSPYWLQIHAMQDDQADGDRSGIDKEKDAN